jgi:hypothetical protein
MGFGDFCFQAMLGKRAGDPGPAIIGIGGVGQVLELAAPAGRKMAARWLLMTGPMLERAIVEKHVARDGKRYVLSACGDPVPPGSNP